MTKEQSKQLRVVRNVLVSGLKSCNNIPSTVAMAALIELMVDTAVTLAGREAAVELICQTVNNLMMTKYKVKK